MPSTPYFTRGLFQFLRELKVNNDRDWFAANRERYVELVEAPMLRFIADLGDHLPAGFVADPRRTGGSMFRIYRDTRFAKDKTPFKTAVAARFAHRAGEKGQSAPGFYIHLEPGDCFAGGGIYHPDPAALKRIRDQIVDEPAAWSAAVHKKKIVVEGDALQRVPRGYDPAHRFAADLKRKDYYTLHRLEERDVCGPRLLAVYLDACDRAVPLMQFLARALGLRWA